jgi:hypothetical protein
MALKITKTARIHEINSDLNSKNVFYLNKLTDFKAFALFAIASLYKKALVNTEVFGSIDIENNSVNEQFKTVKLIPILSKNSL